MSTPGKIGGTLPWMAPEMLDGDGAKTAAGDVWGFGMTVLVPLSPICARRLVAEYLQELFTREDPFYRSAASSLVPLVMKILKGPPDRPSAEDTCFRLTDEWWGICSECWQRDPSKRPTMLQVVEKIEQIVCSLVTRLSTTDRCHFFHTPASGSAMDPSGLANHAHYHSHVLATEHRFSCEGKLDLNCREALNGLEYAASWN